MKLAVELQPCLRNRSGVGIYTYELIKCLQHKSDMQLTGNIFNFFMRHDLTKELEGFIFPQKYCTLLPYGVYRRIWRWLPLPYHWLFGKDADVTHFFNFIVPKGVHGKVVNTIYDVVWLRYPKTMDAKNLQRITQDIHYSIDRSDRIVTISNSTKKDLLELLHIPSEKIVVAPPGVDQAIFQRKYSEAQLQRIKDQYSLPSQYILYMGTLEPRKNIERLVQAFALLHQNRSIQEIKLVLAGKKGWQYDSIFQQIEQHGLQQEVICTGYVEETDKAAIYQQADLFVFPSLYEGFGMPVLEAMAAGVPVITSNVSSLPEVAGDAALLVDPLHIQDLAAKMQQLLTDQQLREMCIARGFQQCETYTWDCSANRLTDLYQALLSE